MPFIEWTEDFATGQPSVDYEHHELISLINTLFEALETGREAAGEVLGDIHAKISAHFALEEKIMRDAHYGEYTVHKADHERLLDDLLDIMDEIDTSDPSKLLGTYAPRIERWFSHHFKTLDARLHNALG
jgi:hemerythrin-like metal-binding protein